MNAHDASHVGPASFAGGEGEQATAALAGGRGRGRWPRRGSPGLHCNGEALGSRFVGHPAANRHSLQAGQQELVGQVRDGAGAHAPALAHAEPAIHVELKRRNEEAGATRAAAAPFP